LQERLKTLDKFTDSLSSNFTKTEYSNHLKRFRRFISDPTIEQDPRLLADHIIKYLVKMKNEEGLSYPYRQLALSAIKHYYEIQTDYILNWKKIAKFLGEQNRANDIKAYEREDIQKLLDVANQKFKAIILTYASTGMRRTPLAHLKLGDLQI
jgi:integrase